MKIATWNVNSLSVRLPHVLEWLQQHSPQVLCLQETKMEDARFPAQALKEAGYESQYFGQKTYNGVAILSREKGTDAVRNLPGLPDEQARVLTLSVAGLRLIGAYFPNGQAPDSEKFSYKMRWLQALEAFVREQLALFPSLVLLGDFNIAPSDADVYDPQAWAGQIHCTPQERTAFQHLLDMGMLDAFRLFEQAPKSWSWWDYRNLAFRKNQGLRIDHILVGQALQSRVTGCWIDKAPRKLERPSDHAPVVLELGDTSV
jgi:exodeoxyribonuclease-3